MQTTSQGIKSRYMLIFIDDLARMSWFYLLQNKFNCFKSFVKFKSLIEKKSSYFIKMLRNDRGGEFLSNEFKNFCHQHGIVRQYITS